MTEQQPSPLYHTHESQQSAEEILAYWTPERLAAAQPLGEGHPAAENRSWPAARQVSPAAEEPGALAFQTTQVPTKKLETFPYQSAGKLFFTMGKVNWTGSGAVVADSGLITAAHCLYDNEKKLWAENVLFCPAFTKGYANDKYGSWPYREIAVPVRWMDVDKDYRPYDIGFVKLFLSNRTPPRQIGKIVSPFSLLVDMKPNSKTTWMSLGYPARSIPDYDFDGDDMWQCTGNFHADADQVILKSGNFTKGASGGPWIFEQDGRYAINGIESEKYSETLNGSSYFGAWVETFLLEFFR